MEANYTSSPSGVSVTASQTPLLINIPTHASLTAKYGHSPPEDACDVRTRPN